MTDLLVLIHTVPPLISVFDRLTRQMLPGITVKHILDEPLLEAVRQRGRLAEEDAERLLSHVKMGMEIRAKAALVTCSTISPLVDTIRAHTSLLVVKIDEAMIDRAVQVGQRIHVVATNPTTLGPTRQLLYEQAARSGREILVTETLVEAALSALLSGDGKTHDRLVRQAVLEASSGTDAVLLAQASMARVIGTFSPDEQTVPVFSSPHLALERLRDFFSNG